MRGHVAAQYIPTAAIVRGENAYAGIAATEIAICVIELCALVALLVLLGAIWALRKEVKQMVRTWKYTRLQQASAPPFTSVRYTPNSQNQNTTMRAEDNVYSPPQVPLMNNQNY